LSSRDAEGALYRALCITQARWAGLITSTAGGDRNGVTTTRGARRSNVVTHASGCVACVNPMNRHLQDTTVALKDPRIQSRDGINSSSNWPTSDTPEMR
jgi:hypothetical protein